MIKNRNDLLYYLKRDKIALGRKDSSYPKIFGDEIWKFQIVLRKLEYYTNCNKGALNKIGKIIYRFLFHKLSIELGYSIPINVFGAGLSIAHYGTIVVNDKARVGENCRIQESVTIGATNGENRAPRLGNNIFIGSGVRIIGDIDIADDVCIGAGSVVVKDIFDSEVTVAGVPAKVISHRGSRLNLNSDLFE